jgi:hypothetical protein
VTTGRNHPCPCGSGRKYKHCCLGKDDGGRKSGAAQEISDAIARAEAEQPFESIEEVNAFASALIGERNQAALADFCGLSSLQMRDLLYAPFDSPQTVRFSVDTAPGREVEVLGIFLAMAEAIGEAGLKVTATGNLPLKFCKTVGQQLRAAPHQGRSSYIAGIRSEMDVEPLHCTRLVAERAGLIRKYRGHFVLTKKCKELLARQDEGGIYLELFKFYTTQFNWAYRDGYPEADIVQHAFLFTLFLLASYGEERRPQRFYEDRFLTAFPTVVEEFAETAYSPAESSARRCYVLRALERFAAVFGLAELVPEASGSYDFHYLVRKTALLDRFVSFTMNAEPDVSRIT